MKLTIKENKTVLSDWTSGLSVPTDEFIKFVFRKIGERPGVATPILPLGTIFYAKKSERECIILEEAPGVRNVKWTDQYNTEPSMRKENHGLYRLSFPFVIFGIGLLEKHIDTSRFFVFYRNRAIRSKNDVLCHTNLHNVQIEGFCCIHPQKGRVRDVAEAAEIVREAFWNHVFNINMRSSDEYWSFAKTTTGKVEKWQEKSKENPLFVLDIDWPKHQLSVDGLAEKLLGDAVSRADDADFQRFVDYFSRCRAEILEKED